MTESEARGEGSDTAVLGGGCFWCMDAALQRLRGVQKVVCGYAGGEVEDPSYREVCRGDTGHAEVVRVTFDPEVLPYRDLLEVFFTLHDPTTVDREGPDVGPQYRSIVLPTSDEQEEVVRDTIDDLEEQGTWDAPVVTEIHPLEAFYPADEHHQDYFRKNPEQAYCRSVIAPKVEKLRRKHRDRLKSEDAASAS